MDFRKLGLLLSLAYIIIGTVTGFASDFLYYLELEDSGKQEFVDSHNHFRRLVSNPEAANMRLMTWDDELAKLARNHVRKCSFAHSTPAELVTDDFPTAGENIYAGGEFYYDELMSTIGVTKKWYDEVQHFNYTVLSCVPGEICGHYTQLVWAQSYKVGCTMARCRAIEGGNPEDLVTCAYGPGGNHYYNGIPLSPYVSGEACSACGEGDLCIDQLCNNTDRDISLTTTTTVPDVTTATETSTTTAVDDTTASSTTTTSSTNTTTETDVDKDDNNERSPGIPGSIQVVIYGFAIATPTSIIYIWLTRAGKPTVGAFPTSTSIHPEGGINDSGGGPIPAVLKPVPVEVFQECSEITTIENLTLNDSSVIYTSTTETVVQVLVPESEHTFASTTPA